MKKRILSVLLVLVMLLSLLPISALAGKDEHKTTYMLKYDANGGNGKFENQRKSTTDESYTFTVRSEKPTKGNMHFMGWADNRDAETARHQGGASITLYKDNPTKTIYAVWKGHTDEDKDGFCDNGGECLHEKDGDGYCTVNNCNHNHGADDCCPLRPQPPQKPTPAQLTALGNIVEVECETDDAHLVDGEDDDERYYALIAGSYDVGDVTGDEKDGYTCTVTVKAELYVAQFSTDLHVSHTLEEDEDNPQTFTLKYENGHWVPDDDDYGKDDYHAVDFDVECDGSSESGKPNPPEFDQLKNLLGKSIKVNCLTSSANHSAESYDLIRGSYKTEVTKSNSGKNYICTVTIDPEKYLEQYDAKTKETHSLNQPDDEKQTNQKFELIWKDDKWERNGNNPVTFNVRCGGAPTQKPGTPITVEVYVDGTQKTASDYVSVSGSADTKDFSATAEGDIFTIKYKYQTHDAADFSVNNSSIAYAIQGVIATVIGGSDGARTITGNKSSVTLDNVKGGTTVKVYLRTLYAVKYDNETSPSPYVYITDQDVRSSTSAYPNKNNQSGTEVLWRNSVNGLTHQITLEPVPTDSTGWYAKADYSDSPYTGTINVSAVSSNANGNRVINFYHKDKTYKVTYSWTGLPTGAVDAEGNPITLPTDTKEYKDGDSYEIDTTYTLNAEAYTVDGAGNVTNTYVFSGWNQEDGKINKADVQVEGTWHLDNWSEKEQSETGGDGIPDKYQVLVKYVSADNSEGTVSPALEVHTLRNADGSYAKSGTVTASGSTATAEDGYSFDKWTDPNGTKIADAGAELGEQTINAEGGTTYTFTAHWELKTYTVTYNANVPEGATGTVTGTPAAQTKTHGVALTLIAGTPVLENYVFTGWNTKEDGTGDEYENGESYEIDENLTLYAQWKNATYPVYVYAKILHGTTNVTSAAANETLIGPSGKLSAVLNGNGAGWITIGKISDATEVEPKEGATAEKDPIVAQLNESNFEPYKGQGNFAGYVGSWNLNPVEKGAVDYVQNYSTWTWHLDGTINAYTVTYNANGGTGADVTDGYYYLSGGSATVIDNSFTAPEGYIFVGWNTEADGNGTEYVIGESYSISADLTLYAQWEEENTELKVTKQVAMINGKPVEPAESYRVKVGDTITWTITVKNMGNVGQQLGLEDKLPDVTVWLPEIAARSVAMDTPESFWLAPNESKTFMASYKTLLSDSGKTLVNEVVVSNGTSSKTAKAEPVYVEPALTVDKAIIAVNGVPVRTAPRVVEVGDTLTYIVTVTNNSNETLRDITVYDTLLDQWFKIGTLKAGESETITYTYTISAREAGTTVLNTAVAYVDNNRINADTAAVDVQHLYPIIPSTPNKPALNTQDHHAYIVGYPDGTVRPEGNITRAEAATIFFRLMTDESRDYYWSTYNSFSDVSRDAWYNNAVSTLASAGIMGGYPDGTFRPDQYITRAEISKIIATFAELSTSGRTFSDIEGHWAEGYIRLATGNGWLEGYPNGSFRPDQYITRAETMTMINRVLGRVPATEDRLLAYRVMLTFSDCQPGDWYYIAVQEATNSHSYERVDSGKAGDEQWIALRENRDWTKLEK